MALHTTAHTFAFPETLKGENVPARKRSARPHNWIHGDAGTTEYGSWRGMWVRCKGGHPRYGGRGITVCARWIEYENFLADMGRKPGRAYSLDRRDNNGNYEPGNCRWATKQEQASNREFVKFLEFNGERLKYREWSERTGLSVMALTLRIRKGWSVARALSEPAHVNIPRPKVERIKCFAPGCSRSRAQRPLCKGHGLAIDRELFAQLKTEHRLMLGGSPNRFAEVLAEVLPMFGGAV